jgi:hypothetical protein
MGTVLNLCESSITTVFLDMDGTLVKHNYTPLETLDEYLPGTIELLTQLKNKEKFYCILTTGRAEIECIYVLEKIKKDLGFTFDRCLYLLPVGVRALVNDSKTTINKAQGFCIPRDQGPTEIIKHFL